MGSDTFTLARVTDLPSPTLLATFQSVIGFGLIALLDMPWSVVGFGFVVASSVLFSRMKAVLTEFDSADCGDRD